MKRIARLVVTIDGDKVAAGNLNDGHFTSLQQTIEQLIEDRLNDAAQMQGEVRASCYVDYVRNVRID